MLSWGGNALHSSSFGAGLCIFLFRSVGNMVYFKTEMLPWGKVGKAVTAALSPWGCGTVKCLIGVRREMCVSWTELKGL